MPTYAYFCETCGTGFDAVQRFSEPPLTACPSGHAQVRRVFTPAGIIFKGSGWYSKDSKASSEKGAKASASDGAKSDGAKGEAIASEGAKSETTPADAPKSEPTPAKAAETS